MIGLFGSLISGVQAAVLERGAWQGGAWNLQTMGAMTGFAVSLYIFYILVPRYYKGTVCLKAAPRITLACLKIVINTVITCLSCAVANSFLLACMG
jgi:D-alanyl-lipoteichoic acid acyltransferase DltB (MBOAT superfamily)